MTRRMACMRTARATSCSHSAPSPRTPVDGMRRAGCSPDCPAFLRTDERLMCWQLAVRCGVIALAGAHLQTRVLCEVTAGARRFPVQAFLLGSTRPDAPAVGFFGGVHGLERIGAQVVIAYLRSLVMRLAWDETLHRQLETMR